MGNGARGVTIEEPLISGCRVGPITLTISGLCFVKVVVSREIQWENIGVGEGRVEVSEELGTVDN